MKLRVLFAFLCSAVLVFGTANDVVVKKRTAAGNLLDYTIAVGNEGDTLTLTGGNPTWSASTGGSTLNGISAATADQAGIANGDFNVRWNWRKTTDSETSFEIGESAASTGGTSTSGVPNQVLAKFSTLAASTASPLSVYSRATHVFSVSPTSTQILAADGSISNPVYSFASDADTGLILSSSNTLGLNAGGVTVADFGSVIGAGAVTFYVSTGNFVSWDSTGSVTSVNAYTSNNSASGNYHFRQSRSGTSAIVSGDDLGVIRAYGYVGSTGNYVEAANILFDSTGTVANNSTGVGGTITFRTRTSGNASVLARALVNDTAVVLTNGTHIEESVDSFSGPGAISVTYSVTKLTSTGTDALTLANGTVGQIKRIVMVGDGGDATLTPGVKTGFSSITFDAVGDSITLQYYTTQGWMVVSNYNCTVNP
jgi:hypothetical protein